MCMRNDEELIIRKHYYESVFVPNIIKRFELNELVTYLTNSTKRFAPIYKLDQLNTTSFEDTSITKFGVINSKNISTRKKDEVLIKFIDSMVNYIFTEMRS